jgi:mRNA-degrading endonuclease YafQ of YafQ-DinJ toxin-antitoxin module
MAYCWFFSHIKPDLVRIYQKNDQDELLILSLVRLGRRSELDLC